MKQSNFTPIFNDGLGLFNGSREKGINILSGNPLGAAKLGIYPNLNNGNVHVKDHTVSVVEAFGKLDLNMNFNSQAQNMQSAWHFSQDKRFLSLPTSHEQSAVLLEGDGHETTYTQSATQPQFYIGPATDNGVSYLYHDGAQWVKYHSGLETCEYYSANGLLQKTQDSVGRSLTYQYDAQNRLSLITVSPSGNQYKLSRTGNKLQIIAIEGTQQTVLMEYQFDAYGRLLQSTVPGEKPYTTTYKYANNHSPAITNIAQSDSSTVNFDYNGTSTSYLSAITFGEEEKHDVYYKGSPNINHVLYPDDKKQGINAAIEDSNGIVNKFKVNSEGDLETWKQACGYEEAVAQSDITSYSYTANGQIQKVTQADGEDKTREYDPFWQHITATTGANGQRNEFVYLVDATKLVSRIICEIDYEAANSQPLVTRYIYDDNFDGKGHAFCRFEISPSGKVTENVPDELTGKIKFQKVYLGNAFPVNNYTPTTTPILTVMQQWSAQQDPSLVKLTQNIYNKRGQCCKRYEFANVNNKGQGIFDELMGITEFEWNIQGEQLSCTVLQQNTSDGPISSTDAKQYDNLNRVVVKTDAEENNTQFSYNVTKTGTQQTTILPNQRTNTVSFGPAGQQESIQGSVQSESGTQQRLTQYDNDRGGRPIVITHPDSRKTIQFFDKQQRLGFTVSATGIVTEHRYDREANSKMTIQYANKVDIAKLYLTYPPQPGDLPYAELLQQQLAAQKSHQDDRTSYKIYDASGRLQYEVDAENYLIEHRYDQRNLACVKIAYHAPLSASELRTILNKESLNRQIGPTQDRVWHTFYDADKNIIGHQDPAGYVVEYDRNPAGWIKTRVRYATKTALNISTLSISDVRPVKNAQDAVTEYSYDHRGNKLRKVDPEGYATQYTYLPNGKLSKKRKFATKLGTAQDRNITILFPPENSEDQVMSIEYDKLNRPVMIYRPLARLDHKKYDCMGNVILSGSKDTQDISSTAEDKQRHQESQFDGWQQKVAHANPWVAQDITLINANPNMNAEQKQAAIKVLWDEHANRNVYDASGLLLSTENSRGLKTVYYYDQEHRPIYQINSEGIIVTKGYNSFAEVVAKRQFVNKLTSSQFAQLKGGFATTAVANLINSAKDDTKDAIVQHNYSKRGQVQQTIDADGYQTIFDYNAFLQLATQQLSIDATTPSVTISKEYEPRGLKKSETKSADGKTISQSFAHDNLYGKQTAFTDANDGVHSKRYDRRGMVHEEVNSLAVTTATNQYDAFKRLSVQQDALGNVTTIEHNQAKRTREVKEPIAGTGYTDEVNIFRETVKSTNALGDSESWTHSAGGAIATHTDALNNQDKKEYDLEGGLTDSFDKEGVHNKFTLNQDGAIAQESKDISGLNLQTNFTRNGLQDATQVLGPKRVIAVPDTSASNPLGLKFVTKRVETKQEFDKRHNCTTQTVDPSTSGQNNLNITTTTSYNGQSTKITTTVGDASSATLAKSQQQRDVFNRDAGVIVDPDNLHIADDKTLDDLGLVIAIQDPNGNVTRQFFDALGHKRFSVTPEGGVTEWSYNKLGLVSFVRHYEQGVDPANLSSDSNLSQLETILKGKTSTDDTVIWYFYDKNKRKSFKVNSQGSVWQWRYDDAGRKQAKILYNTAYDSSELWQMSESKLQTWTQAQAQNCRTSYYIVDKKGQVCFSIDPKGAIIEHVYDKKGRVIAEIEYQAWSSNPSALATMSVAQVKQHILYSMEEDRYEYTIYNSQDKPLFHIDAEGALLSIRMMRNKISSKFVNLIKR